MHASEVPAMRPLNQMSDRQLAAVIEIAIRRMTIELNAAKNNIPSPKKIQRKQ